ncbi:MAG TPA: hypothetical protein VEV82_04355, partial [Actinomycetota bacterium]|nr:hypothetical protein [Actinomycetota bacterium]
ILTLGTMSMNVDGDQLGDCAPVAPLSRLGPTDVLIFITEVFGDWEFGPGNRPWTLNPDEVVKDLSSIGQDVSARPQNLGVEDLVLQEADCWSREVYQLTFVDSGRTISVQIALGEDVTPEWQGGVSDVLDSLRFDPMTELEAIRSTITQGGNSGDESQEVDFMSEGPTPSIANRCQKGILRMSELHCRAVIAITNGELEPWRPYSNEELRELLGS